MDICPNGTLVTHETFILNNVTYKEVRCIPAPMELDPLFFIMIGSILGVWIMFVLVVLFAKYYRRNEPIVPLES
jgi:hypothetical protein